MSFINLMGTKKETRKTSLILWAASLALLAQQPLLGMDEKEQNDHESLTLLMQQLTLEGISEDEVLSMSEGTIAQIDRDLQNSGNTTEVFRNYAESCKSAATQATELFGELVNPDIERCDSAITGFAPSHVNIDVALVQAQNTLVYEFITYETQAAASRR